MFGHKLQRKLPCSYLPGTITPDRRSALPYGINTHRELYCLISFTDLGRQPWRQSYQYFYQYYLLQLSSFSWFVGVNKGNTRSANRMLNRRVGCSSRHCRILLRMEPRRRIIFHVHRGSVNHWPRGHFHWDLNIMHDHDSLKSAWNKDMCLLCLIMKKSICLTCFCLFVFIIAQVITGVNHKFDIQD